MLSKIALALTLTVVGGQAVAAHTDAPGEWKGQFNPSAALDVSQVERPELVRPWGRRRNQGPLTP